MVRFAARDDLARVNELRAQVHAVHAEGRPDIFYEESGPELKAYAENFLTEENKALIVAEREGIICGFACVELITKPASITCKERDFYAVHEFGVDKHLRRSGVGRELFAFIKADAKERGFDRIELNMWEFNESALKFYESVGFKTYRRYMEFEND
ncbi:MAG: GNAT family N-acetyltransferase [Lachnospiraceae bacterium]|nr:GNAT family N-acetyltransferase [Lachnospiraceae bacterium]